jgi:flagellar FliL protein
MKKRDIKTMAKKKLILIIVPVLLLLIGAGVFFSGVLNKKETDPKDAGHESPANEVSEEPKEDEKSAKADPIFFEMPDVIVNIKGKGKTKATNLLKIKINLELGNPESLPIVEKRLPRLIDQMQTYLRELRVEDLEGSEGLLRLREELLKRIQATADGADIKDVLFAEMILQ